MILVGLSDDDATGLRFPTNRRRSSALIIGVLLLLMAVAAGCHDDLDDLALGPKSTEGEAEVARDANTDFQVAIEYLDNFHQFDTASATERILYHLQRWAQTRQPDPDWIADPLYSQLPDRFARMKTPTFLSRMKFELFDIMSLREAIWMRDLARQMQDQQLRDERLNKWLAQHLADADEKTATDLRFTMNVMDWVVRNIEQDPVPSELTSSGDEETPQVQLQDGASLLPGESLMIGHGDWLLRSRIAIAIGRQGHVPMTMLAIDDDQIDRPWCLAALVNQQLYLFDMKLGLPIPLENGEGIATLHQLLDHPQWLEQLNDPEGATYRISQDDLANIVALIDSTPEFLSQRMKTVESALPSRRKMVLSSTPSSLKKELATIQGITNVRLWTIPYDAYLQRQQMLAKGQMAPYLVQLNRELAIVGGPTSLANGRRQHFRGQYASTDDEPGAKAYYMNSRPSDSVIDQRISDDRLAETLGMNPEQMPEDPQVIRSLVDAHRLGMRTHKRYATYWLGLISFEQGKYETAVNFFKKRLLDRDTDAEWTQGARYNLARTYEQMGYSSGNSSKFSDARRYYIEDANSPQAAGNRIRAARLPTDAPAVDGAPAEAASITDSQETDSQETDSQETDS